MNKDTEITEYDLYGYDYENYWKEGRNYEDASDKLAISKFLKNETGDWFIDLGGSYGRLSPLYKSKYLHCILADYSLEALKKAKRNLKDQRISNFEFVALNAYNLPFKDKTLNAGQMIRVMHHLEHPEYVIEEVSRVTKDKGFFILEFANKIHFIAKIKAILTFKPQFIFSKEIYRQPTRETKQGTKGQGTLFFNFHPTQIKKLAIENDFKVEKKLSVSNLRSGIIKKLLSAKILLALENLLQNILSFTTFGPSQYRKLRKVGNQTITPARDVYEILCCPKCKGELDKKSSNLICRNCKEEFPINYGIYDLRWPRPTQA